MLVRPVTEETVAVRAASYALRLSTKMNQGQKQCKECTTDLCAAVPGATTNQAEGEDTLQEEYCDEHQLELD